MLAIMWPSTCCDTWKAGGLIPTHCCQLGSLWALAWRVLGAVSCAPGAWGLALPWPWRSQACLLPCCLGPGSHRHICSWWGWTKGRWKALGWGLKCPQERHGCPLLLISDPQSGGDEGSV